MSDIERLQQIEKSVRATICDTYSSDGRRTIEGRILKDDFDFLIGLLWTIQSNERERCARLHEQINPASDDERYHNVPGAGAMAAVIEYRDLIRAQP